MIVSDVANCHVVNVEAKPPTTAPLWPGGFVVSLNRELIWVSENHVREERLSDPATQRTGRVDCNRSAMAGIAGSMVRPTIAHTLELTLRGGSEARILPTFSSSSTMSAEMSTTDSRICAALKPASRR